MTSECSACVCAAGAERALGARRAAAECGAAAAAAYIPRALPSQWGACRHAEPPTKILTVKQNRNGKNHSTVIVADMRT